MSPTRIGAPRRDVVVVVDSHIQRSVLATEETTVTQQVSHRPIKCQSRLWSQRGTTVNGSHHGDNPLLRPTGIQIATKRYAALQAMAPTNIKTVHQTSLLNIENNLDRFGMLSPTHDQRSQQKNGKFTLQPVLINKSKFLKITYGMRNRRRNVYASLEVRMFWLGWLGCLKTTTAVGTENTGLTASTMDVRCHMKDENERRSLYYCW